MNKGNLIKLFIINNYNYKKITLLIILHIEN